MQIHHAEDSREQPSHVLSVATVNLNNTNPVDRDEVA